MTQKIGFHYLIAGFDIIRQPGIKRFVVIPIFINLIMFVALFFLMRHYVSEFNIWFEHHLPSWLHWLGIIIWFIFFISFFLIFIYAFVAVANIVCAPFNSLLAEKVEFLLTRQLPPEKNTWHSIKDIPRMLWRQLCIIGYYLPRALGILILFLIPGINAIAAPLWFLFSAWFMAIQYLDFPTDNHGIPIKKVREWMSDQTWTSLTFGISILVVMMIPVLNIVAMPAAVAGATKFWLEEKRN